MDPHESIEIPFLGEWNDLRRERRELRERMARLEYEEGKFSDAVLARVRLDYERRLLELESQLEDLTARAQNENNTLTTAVAQQESEVRECRLGLEEFELRERVGERLDDESARRASERRAELAGLEDDLKAMVELRDRVQAIVEGHTGEFATVVPPPIEALVASPPELPELLPPIPPPTPIFLPSLTRTSPIVIPQMPRLVPVESVDGADHFALLPLTVVGRVAESDLRLPVGTVSRRHAEIEWTGESWRLRDLHSENGTWVNGDRVFERLLADGDQIQFGTVQLVFRSS